MRVSPKTIQALTLFVADKKELRSYLRSISFELQIERTILTATNGHALLTICIDEPNDKEDTFKIMPGSFMKSEIDYDVTRAEDGKVYITNGLAKTEVPQDGLKYLDFRRAIPTKQEDTIAHKSYDPELLMLFKKASKLLCGTKYPIIHQNNIVDIGLGNVVVVQMPLRVENIKTKDVPIIDVAPAWLELPQNNAGKNLKMENAV